MKRRADMLIDGNYKRITIWDALEYKKNQPDFWKEHKEKIYTISKKPENKVRLVFNTGKYGVLENSFFSLYNAEFARNHDGSEESYEHEFFKECVSRINQLELRWFGESLTIFPDEFLPIRRTKMKLEGFDFNTGWKKKECIQLSDRKYEVIVKIQAYSKEDSLTAEQEANYDEYLGSSVEWVNAVEKKLREYAEDYLERLLFSTLNDAPFFTLNDAKAA